MCNTYFSSLPLYSLIIIGKKKISKTVHLLNLKQNTEYASRLKGTKTQMKVQVMALRTWIRDVASDLEDKMMKLSDPVLEKGREILV